MENIASLKEKWFKNEVERLANKGISKADISRALDIKPQYLNSVLNGSRGLADTFLDKFIEAYNINQFDLLSPANDAAISAMSLRLMDKLDAQEAENKQLQSELRSKSEELAVLKAKYQHPDEVAFAFTPGSSEAYTENSSPTKKPITPSKKLSAGKI